MKKAIVIIPTIGNPDLLMAVKSVLSQSYQETYCLVVVDGPKFKNKVDEILFDISMSKEGRLFRCDLPFNTGANGFYGQRIMTSFAYLTDFDYIFYLDQDTWFEENHIECMIKTIEENNYEWCYSLRKIFSKEGEYICNDDCESLGKWPIWHSDDQYLVDNNCFGFTKEFLTANAHLMYWGWGADRRFFMLVKDRSKYGCTGMYSVDYRLGGNEGSVQEEFFKQGNRVMRDRHLLTGFPWRNATIDLPFKV